MLRVRVDGEALNKAGSVWVCGWRGGGGTADSVCDRGPGVLSCSELYSAGSFCNAKFAAAGALSMIATCCLYYRLLCRCSTTT